MKNLTFLRRGGGRGPWGGKGAPIHKFILISIIIGKHMNRLCFKFHQNHTINEEFDFFEGGGIP